MKRVAFTFSVQYYDNFGNLLAKTTTNRTTNAIIKTDTYQYSNSNWKDQLTSNKL